MFILLASMRQVLMDAAIKISNSNIFEQGSGKLDLIGRYNNNIILLFFNKILLLKL